MRKGIARTGTMVVFVALVLGVYAAAEPAWTVYDPLYGKNLPEWRVSTDRLGELLENWNPAFLRWNDVDAVQELYDSRMRKMEDEREMKRQQLAVPKKMEITKEYIAEELGLFAVYDPVMKRNIPIRYLTKEEMVSLLNNPHSQRMTFANQDPKWVEAMLKDLKIKGDYEYPFDSSGVIKRMTI